MNIWIDIYHVPQFNFYKQVLLALSQGGHHVYLTILNRGKNIKIANKELLGVDNIEIIPLGKHRMTKLSAIIEANVFRIPQVLLWKRKHNVDITFSNGFHSALASAVSKIPNYSFDDDPQTVDYRFKVKYNTECNFCVYEDKSVLPPARVLPVLKEWAYLAPKYFEPHIEALQKYGVKPKEYVFLREVSVGTVNYAGQERGAIRNIQHLIPKNKKVLFSLEEKNRRGEYPEDWILLQEPIEDIHSLIYYSAGLVSSGDSMAREAALLGVPSYYLGVRHSMPANAAASKVANLQNELTMPFSEWIKTLECDPKEAEQKQQELREYIDSKFIDINEYMLSLVHKVEQEKKNKK